MKPIRSDREYRKALKQIESIFKENRGEDESSPRWKKFDKLVDEIVKYEKKRFKIG